MRWAARCRSVRSSLVNRVANRKSYYLRKAQASRSERAGHRRRGRASRLGLGALPGSTHDLTAARTHGIIDALTGPDVMTFADKGYQGALGSVRTPLKRRRFRPKLSRRQKAVNRAHAKIRARGERAIATLKTWRLLVKLRCCPRRATAIVQAHPRPAPRRRRPLRRMKMAQ
ncbi:transposase family protein [Micromonospora sp.]|uniref:transposase family protein n=1 Tax=Micromonospora sp. TaxID=1876 RepID=UPI003B3AFF4B